MYWSEIQTVLRPCSLCDPGSDQQATRHKLIESAKTRIRILEERMQEARRQGSQSQQPSLGDDPEPFLRDPCSHANPDAPWAVALVEAAAVNANATARGNGKPNGTAETHRAVHHAHDPRDRAHTYVHGHKNIHHGHGHGHH